MLAKMLLALKPRMIGSTALSLTPTLCENAADTRRARMRGASAACVRPSSAASGARVSAYEVAAME